MKFAKRLTRDRIPEWATKYVSYKQLKKLIKAAVEAGGGEQHVAAFADALRAEVDRAGSFFHEELAACVQFVDEVQAVGGPEQHGDRIAWQKAGHLVSNLRWFVVLNFTAVRKIVKKFNKKVAGLPGFKELSPLDFVSDAPFVRETPQLQRLSRELQGHIENSGQEDSVNLAHMFGNMLRPAVQGEGGESLLGSGSVEGFGPADTIRSETIAPARQRKVGNRRVLLLALDGMRPDALLLASSPNLKKFVTEGAYSFHATCDYIPVSAPSWTSIFTGVKCSTHGVFDNTFNFRNNALEQLPTFLRVLKNADPSIRTAAVYAWDGIGKLLNMDADVLAHEPSDDKEVSRRLRDLLEDDDCPEAIVAYFEEVDIAGHNFGFSPSTKEYIEAIDRVDAHVGKIMAAVHERENQHGEVWTVICTTDHGGSCRRDMPAPMRAAFDIEEMVRCHEARQFEKGATGQLLLEGVHGLHHVPQHYQTFVLARGSLVRCGEIMPHPLSVDVAPSCLGAMGVSIPEHMDGSDLFADYSDDTEEARARELLSHLDSAGNGELNAEDVARRASSRRPQTNVQLHPLRREESGMPFARTGLPRILS